MQGLVSPLGSDSTMLGQKFPREFSVEEITQVLWEATSVPQEWDYQTPLSFCFQVGNDGKMEFSQPNLH